VITPAILTPLVGGLIFLALVLLVGVVVTGWLVDSAAVTPADGAARIRGWLLRLPSLLAWFLLMLLLIRGALQILAFSDPTMPADSELVRAVLTTGAWGNAWLVELAAAFSTLALAWLFAARPRGQRLALSVTVLLAILAEAGVGHGVEAVWRPLVLGRLVHASHLLGAGIWIGTLMILALTVIPTLLHTDAREPLARVIGRFSIAARLGVTLLFASGFTMTWMYTARLVDLATPFWGRLLLLKLAILTPALALGWYNWRVVTPRLRGGVPPAARTLRRSVLIEVALAVLILAVTAVLVTQALPIDGVAG
jgi:putative copper export protein